MKYKLFVFVDGRFSETYFFGSYQQAMLKSSQLKKSYSGTTFETKIIPFK